MILGKSYHLVIENVLKATILLKLIFFGEYDMFTPTLLYIVSSR